MNHVPSIKIPRSLRNEPMTPIPKATALSTETSKLTEQKVHLHNVESQCDYRVELHTKAGDKLLKVKSATVLEEGDIAFSPHAFALEVALMAVRNLKRRTGDKWHRGLEGVKATVLCHARNDHPSSTHVFELNHFDLTSA